MLGLRDVRRTEHDCAGRLNQRRAPVPPARTGALGNAAFKAVAKADAVGDLPQQHHARTADLVLGAGPHGKPMIPAGILRPSGASPSRSS
ncbi:hypothetical protein GCM10017771_81830 [Streptomyces capitiformicae]|uniref:Uncharacterized protein n=1 Tax=Streptomyces capitiformicae TaxID=2014920 RepID=A0A918ZLB1_9ACTN|nr:hypothetical protein GCM10017771_81830 [Streptomyces capitiformicae]